MKRSASGYANRMMTGRPRPANAVRNLRYEVKKPVAKPRKPKSK